MKGRLSRWACWLLISLTLVTGACMPAHNVKPLPDFVETGIEPGDQVIVTTKDGRTARFVVTDVRDETLFGEGERIPISDIAVLKKRSWSRPASPCGGEKPLGCSLPVAVSVASESHAHYREEFHDACAEHDYCYRHGYRTYGVTREECDLRFLADMRNLCPPPAGNVVAKTLQVLDDSVESRRTCLAVADSFYLAVSEFGEGNFEIEGSTYCEYDGPP